MLGMMIFLCILTVFISIFIVIVLLKGYTLIKDYNKRGEDPSHFHTEKKELEDGITQPVQNNNINKREEDFAYLHLKIKELEDRITQSVKNNAINNHDNSNANQKYELPTPKIILDNKIYSQQEFSKEINSGKFQMSPMLQSKLYKKDK